MKMCELYKRVDYNLNKNWSSKKNIFIGVLRCFMEKSRKEEVFTKHPAICYLTSIIITLNPHIHLVRWESLHSFYRSGKQGSKILSNSPKI